MTLRWTTLAVALALVAGASHAQDPGQRHTRIRVAGVPLGSGLPSSSPIPEDADADHVADGDFHAPGVLPYHPTAASLWPRVVRVPCSRDLASGDLRCAGYDVSPMRGEYVYVRPVMVAPPPRPPAPRPVPKPPPPKPPPIYKKPLG